MAPEPLDETACFGEMADPTRELLENLGGSVRKAFGLAKAGAPTRGYLLLGEGREQAVATLSAEDPRAAELRRHWDAALRWFERFAPPPF
jgi:hypothetical protein